MKKVFIFCLSLIPFMGFSGEPEIELKELPQFGEEQKSQIPVFHAEVDLGKSVSVTADQQSTFIVSIYDAANAALLYQGSTYDGYCHFTSTLPSGIYYLVISGLGYSYEGEFKIIDD